MTTIITRDAVVDRVFAVVRNSLGFEEDESLSLDSTFLVDLATLPFQFLMMKLELSQEFGIEISRSELFIQPANAMGWMVFAVSRKMNIGDVVDYICQRLGVEQGQCA